MSIVKFLLDLLYPPRCPFCNVLLDERKGGRENPGIFEDDSIIVSGWEGQLCRRCAAELPWLAGAECCPRCAYLLTEDGEQETCAHCRGLKFYFDECVALGYYLGEIRRVVHRLKYGGKRSLARPLGSLLAAKLSTVPWLSSVDLLVPVPLHRQRLIKRGYNQAALLSKAVGKKLQLPVKEILLRVKDTQSQTGLIRGQRKKNIEGAFRCREELREGCHLLLLDDVLTSGATAGEAARVLKAAGAGRISVAVTALVPLSPRRIGKAPSFRI